MAVVKDNATVPNSRTTEETLPMAVVRDNESEADNVNGERLEAINLVRLVFFFFYWPEFWKKHLGPETVEMYQFLGPETDP